MCANVLDPKSSDRELRHMNIDNGDFWLENLSILL